jgi:hypothetical protein
MALTGAQKTALAAIIYETPAYVASLVTNLDSDIETYITGRLTAYALVGSHVKLKGGKQGLDFDESRDREHIRIELRTVLGLSPISSNDPNSNAMSIMELEVGSNFA